MTQSFFRDIENSDQIKQMVSEFALLEGRQPRVMLSSALSLENDAKVSDFAVSLSGLGFDVDVGPVARNPRQLGLNALENDVDVLILFQVNAVGDRVDFQLRLQEFLRQQGRDDLLTIYNPSGLSYSKVLDRLIKWLSEIRE